MPIRVEHQPSYHVVGEASASIGAGQRSEAYAQFAAQQQLQYDRMAAQQQAQEASYDQQVRMLHERADIAREQEQYQYDVQGERRTQQFNARVARIRQKQSEGKYTRSQADEYIGKLEDQLVGMQDGQIRVPQRPRRTVQDAMKDQVYEDQGKIVTHDPRTGQANVQVKPQGSGSGGGTNYELLNPNRPASSEEISKATAEVSKVYKGQAIKNKKGDKVPYDPGSEAGQQKIIDYIKGQRAIQFKLLPKDQQDALKEHWAKQEAAKKQQLAHEKRIQASPEYKARQARIKMEFASRMAMGAKTEEDRKRWDAEREKQRRALLKHRKAISFAGKEKVNQATGEKILTPRDQRVADKIMEQYLLAANEQGADSEEAKNLIRAYDRMHATTNKKNVEDAFERIKAGEAALLEPPISEEEQGELDQIDQSLRALHDSEAKDREEIDRILYNVDSDQGMGDPEGAEYNSQTGQIARLEARKSEILEGAKSRRDNLEEDVRRNRDLLSLHQENTMRERKGEDTTLSRQSGATPLAQLREKPRLKGASTKLLKQIQGLESDMLAHPRYSVGRGKVARQIMKLVHEHEKGKHMGQRGSAPAASKRSSKGKARYPKGAVEIRAAEERDAKYVQDAVNRGVSLTDVLGGVVSQAARDLGGVVGQAVKGAVDADVGGSATIAKHVVSEVSREIEPTLRSVKNAKKVALGFAKRATRIIGDNFNQFRHGKPIQAESLARELRTAFEEEVQVASGSRAPGGRGTKDAPDRRRERGLAGARSLRSAKADRARRGGALRGEASIEGEARKLSPEMLDLLKRYQVSGYTDGKKIALLRAKRDAAIEEAKGRVTEKRGEELDAEARELDAAMKATIRRVREREREMKAAREEWEKDTYRQQPRRRWYSQGHRNR